MPIITGRSEKVRDTAFSAYRRVQRALRDGRWKLIRYPQINRTQLFDLATDPYETHDLSSDPTNAERIEAMLQQMKQWQKRLGDKLSLTVDQPKDDKWTAPGKKKRNARRKDAAGT